MCASREGADLHPGIQAEDKVRTGLNDPAPFLGPVIMSEIELG